MIMKHLNVRRMLMAALTCLVSVDMMGKDISAVTEEGIELWFDYINDQTELQLVTLSSIQYMNDPYSYTGFSKITIPETVLARDKNGKAVRMKVTSLGKDVFYKNTDLKTVILPKELKEIGYNSFFGCSGLESIELPNSMKVLGSAFGGCTALKSIVLPEGIESIDFSRFSPYASPSFESLIIPGSVANMIFRGNDNIKSVIIQEGVTRIGDYAFEGCTNLTSVSLPSTLETIEGGAFFSCSSLESLSLPMNIMVANNAFQGCTRLTAYSPTKFYKLSTLYEGSYTLPDGIEKIIQNAFSGCTNLSEVIIPESVYDIGNYAFNGCWNLRNLVLAESADSVEIKIAPYILRNCHDVRLEVHRSINPGSWSNSNGKRLCCFCEDAAIQSLYIGKELENLNVYGGAIGNYKVLDNVLFRGCSNLKSIMIDPENKVYDSRENCNGIIETSSNSLVVGVSTTTLPSTLVSINSNAFINQTDLTKVILPQNLQAIGSQAFEDCVNLEQIYALAESPFSIDDDVFNIGTYSKATLYVPVGSLLKYQTADTWSLFSKMKEGEPSGIQTTVSALSIGYEYYTVGGVQTNGMQRGLTIIKSKDGTARKVIRK